MSTPQNPGDSDAPQDPSDPQNPYGTPPSTPPSTPPPPPPASPPPASPPPSTPPPPYVPPSDPGQPTGQPTSEPPADPTPPTTAIPAVTPPAAAPPPYGQPDPGQQPPVAQPGYPQPGYPQPGYPRTGPMPGQYAPPGSGEPGKGMAIGALIASILGCTCLGILVAVPLAIVVLVRGRDGRNHGKGLAIAALVLSVLWLIGGSIGGYFLYDYAKDLKDVDSLKAGDCFTAKGLTDESETGVTQIRSVGCSAKHDGEVLSTATLSSDQAATYGDTSPVDICTPSVTAAGSAALLADPDLIVIALTQDASPGSGDKLVCVIANTDGSKLTSKLGS